MSLNITSHRSLIPAMAILVAMPAATVAPLRPAMADSIDLSAQAADPAAGTLLLRGLNAAATLPALRLGTDMDVTVTGSVARVRVTQAFRNTSNAWMEATYLYPLPQDGAVDSLKLVIGQRVIIGHIEKRAAARAIYEKAATNGQKAGLVEQQRPNMFTNSLANVGPGETVLVSIEYQAPVRQVNGTFSLRLPLVVGPRYTPPHTLVSAAAVADAHAVTSAPVLDPRLGQRLNPTSITVHLKPGFAAANVISRYHPVVVSGAGGDRTIRLAAGEVPADRDFELNWRSASADPTLGLFREQSDGDYVMATITPPSDLSSLPTPPREMVFVIDNSGSMGGASMAEAKSSLIHALTTLRPQDHFNVIRFDDSMTQLFTHSVAATPDQVALAKRFAEGLEASGGTEMLPALKAALADAAASGGASAVRQIIFLTDGAVSNENEMLAAIAQDAGRSHIFLVGIGSAPNDYLMSRMATFGHGTYTHIGTPEEVAAKMIPLLEALRRPAMRNISVKIAGGKLDLTPRILPDIYAGEPLVLIGKADRLAGTLTVSGTIGTRNWSQSIDLGAAQPSTAIAKLWARRRIDDIEADRILAKIDNEVADAQIAAIGIEHSLVTSQTSLVAIDQTPTRPEGEGLSREDLPINLPAGWAFNTLFGGESGKAAMRNSNTLAARAAAQAKGLSLPETATGFARTMIGGLTMLIIGLAAMVALRRRESVMRMSRRGWAMLLPGLLCGFGAIQIAAGAWIPAKAVVAQILLERAFDRSVGAGAPQKPWSWADMAPVARISVPRLGIDRIVLNGGSGQAMAFGPTLLPGGARIGGSGTIVLAAHRDTHFRFLEHVRNRDLIRLRGLDGKLSDYRVTGTEIVRWDGYAVRTGAAEQALDLVTCYPFGAVRQGPLRYVVHAEARR